MKDIIRAIIADNVKVSSSVASEQIDSIQEVARLIIEAMKNGKKILIFGNGGSAADSQHFAAELIGRFKRERGSYNAIALTTDTSSLTAIANDYGYDSIFSRQIEGLAENGDIAFGISTSGNSANVLSGMHKAKSMGLVTIALTGGDGGRLREESSRAIVVPSSDTPRIQEAHGMIIHILCELIERELS